jgi:uncharacterized membrane protein HdeD (DUF308 family)
VNRKERIILAVVGVVLIVAGISVFAWVVPTAKSIPDKKTDTTVGALLFGFGIMAVEKAIADALGK